MLKSLYLTGPTITRRVGFVSRTTVRSLGNNAFHVSTSSSPIGSLSSSNSTDDGASA
jgi:hypothetical protein